MGKCSLIPWLILLPGDHHHLVLVSEMSPVGYLMEKLLFVLGFIPSNNIYPKPASAAREVGAKTPHPSAPSPSLSQTLAGFCIYLPRLGNSLQQEQDQWWHHCVVTIGFGSCQEPMQFPAPAPAGAEKTQITPK